MPPAMTSPRGAPARPPGGGTLNGTIPRREPLRRLYPLQRSRTASDSIRELTNRPDAENCPDVVDAAYVSGKRRAPARASSVSGVTGNNMAGSGKYITHRAYTSSPDRSASSADKTNYSRPSLIRRSSDIGSVTSYASSCPVHGGSDVSSSSGSGRSSRQGSILKRPSSRRVRDLAAVTLTPKQVQFCPNVSVVHMDEDGEHLSTQYQELNGEKRKRLGTLSRQSSRNYDNVFYLTDDLPSTTSSSHDQRRSHIDHQGAASSQHASRDTRFRELFKRLNGGSVLRETSGGEENTTPLKRGQFNITFSNRAGEPTKMRFVLHMGAEYHPNDLVVKANTTGSRIRVLATRTAPPRGAGGNQTLEEFNEKYMLPMDIDPYEIEARLDKWGNLTVEAPLLTTDKRAEVNKANNVLCAIYV